MHKNRSLVKPMMVVGTDGYTLTVLGPYYADGKNNDASITESIFDKNAEEIKSWLEPGDLFIVDRGFRDCLDTLEDLGIATKMPHFLKKGEKQHSVSEANESRLVTKVRYGIKRWKALDHVLPNSQIPYIGDYVRIVSALCNAFRPPIMSNSDADTDIAEKILEKVREKNPLQEKAVKENWSRRNASWTAMDAADLEFPVLSESHLRDITLGVYQVKQAKSYTQEHLDQKGNYDIFVHRQEAGILRAKIQSRHVVSKLYYLWISYNSADITGWYCQCRAGARVVGCCAHITAVLWYIGIKHHEGNLTGPAKNLHNYLEDAAESKDADSKWDVSENEANVNNEDG